MEQYHVTGMTCAACQSRVEKAVSKVPGVESCAVSLLTNSMGVEGSASSADIIKAVTDAGYGAKLMSSGAGAGANGAGANGTNGTGAGTGAGAAGGTSSAAAAAAKLAMEEEMLKDTETPVLKKRLIMSIGFLCVLMYFSMGHMMWGFPIPAWFIGNHVAMGLLQMILAAIIMLINKKFFISGFTGLMHKAPNMDTLVALGSGASFVYSVFALFLMTDAVVKGSHELVMHYMDEFYFESAAMILTLITVGKMLEARSKGKTTDALKGLMKLAPKTAVVVRDGEERTIPIGELMEGEIFVVRPGENIPVDGVVLEGTSAVNEAALTGESIPADKTVGDTVSAATINQSGFLKCQATRVGEDTTLSQIIKMVSDAAATKAPIAKIADTVSGIFVPVVISIAVVTLVIWMLLGAEFGYALARGISVLVISCPCALGLATPVAIMVGNGMGAKNGIMFKTAVSLEETGRGQIVVLDKTGTITQGEPRVTHLAPAEGVSEAELLRYAGALEAQSEHPLARAVMEYVKAHANGAPAPAVADFQALPGNGLMAEIDGVICQGGSRKYIQSIAKMPEDLKKQAEEFSANGETPLFFAKERAAGSGRYSVLGLIAVADTIKPESPEAIRQLKAMGIHVVMLTGDNERTAQAIGRQVGVNEVVAGVLPDGKESVIRQLKEKGKVIMVGDGINDAPALTRADIGIAIGAGTDVAIDAADVVLMKSRLSDIPAAIRLSRATLTNIHENLFWAFFYNVLGIPLAAGLYVKLFGWSMNPMFGAAAMSLSSFFVVSNALRLNLFKIFDPSKDKALKKQVSTGPDGRVLQMESSSFNQGLEGYIDENAVVADDDYEEENLMKKYMSIEGMMCGHCEKRVRKALEALENVKEVSVSHEEGCAIVAMDAEIADDVLKNAVEAQDYAVKSVKVMD